MPNNQRTLNDLLRNHIATDHYQQVSDLVELINQLKQKIDTNQMERRKSSAIRSTKDVVLDGARRNYENELILLANMSENDFYKNCHLMMEDLLRDLKPKPQFHISRIFYSPVSHSKVNLLKDVAHMTATVRLVSEVMSDSSKLQDAEWTNAFEKNETNIRNHLKSDMPSKKRIIWGHVLMTAGALVMFASWMASMLLVLLTFTTGAAVIGVGISLVCGIIGYGIASRGAVMVDNESVFHAQRQQDLHQKATVMLGKR